MQKSAAIQQHVSIGRCNFLKMLFSMTTKKPQKYSGINLTKY